MKYLAIDIGGTFTKYALIGEDGFILRKDRTPTRKESQKDFLDMLVKIFEEECLREGESPGGIAVSCAGFVDSEAGLIKNAGTLYCVKDLFICDELSDRCHVPAAVENDARCAALAEVWRGSLTECENAAVMILGTALGGSLIHGKKILTGKRGMAGEFSYILTNSEEPMNPEMTAALYCGVPALLRLAARDKKIPSDTLSGEEVFRLAVKGNPDVIIMTGKI